MKMTVFLAMIGFAMFANANEIRDFTRETCQSSTSEKTFRCPSYVNECAQVALRKLEFMVADTGTVLDLESLRVNSVDDRAYNPSKYVWFEVNAKRADGSDIILRTMTQKAFFSSRGCF